MGCQAYPDKKKIVVRASEGADDWNVPIHIQAFIYSAFFRHNLNAEQTAEQLQVRPRADERYYSPKVISDIARVIHENHRAGAGHRDYEKNHWKNATAEKALYYAPSSNHPPANQGYQQQAYGQLPSSQQTNPGYYGQPYAQSPGPQQPNPSYYSQPYGPPTGSQQPSPSYYSQSYGPPTGSQQTNPGYYGQPSRSAPSQPSASGYGPSTSAQQQQPNVVNQPSSTNLKPGDLILPFHENTDDCESGREYPAHYPTAYCRIGRCTPLPPGYPSPRPEPMKLPSPPPRIEGRVHEGPTPRSGPSSSKYPDAGSTRQRKR